MKPTIAVFSSLSLMSLIHKLVYKSPDTVNFVVIDSVLDDALKKAKEMEENGEADVFLSAGGNAKLLSQHLKSPFVEIKPTGFDILLALKEAKKYSDSVGIITFQQKIRHLDQLAEVLNITVKQDTFNNINDVRQILDRLINEGVDTVIGASMVIEVAKEKKMNGIFIYSTDGVAEALDTAIQIALANKAEAAKAEELRTILDFAYGGIIAADKEGIITVYNPSAEKILGIPKQTVIGRSIENLLPNIRLKEDLRNNQRELNQIQSVGDIRILTNRVPIEVNHEVSGLVVTFQDTGTIQEADEKIRQRLYQKGFIAKTTLEDIIGKSDLLLKAKREAFLYAKNDYSVLIKGESGTGKELFAQGIHNASLRARHPFVAINCAALPENLLESELFGYEEGAFTGARKGGKQGLFEMAHRGTIFLDEIGEISTQLQSRLLRVLEEHEILRIGGERIRPVNIRVVAATNKNLWKMVEKDCFREDLYYRLNVLELNLPPLRMRKPDIPTLVTKFLTELRGDLTLDEIKGIANCSVFRDHLWPGNVRELKNWVERFAVLYTGEADYKEILSSMLHKQTSEQVSNHETDEIISILKDVGGNKTKAAAKLGISRTTLWRKLKGSDSSDYS